jgi:hypothetical protein
MPLNSNINRVAIMIQRQQAAVTERLATGKVTQERLAELNTSLNMDVGEYCRFQALKSFAFAAGKLTLEEAQTIYAYLGTSVEAFNRQPLTVKAVLTQIFQELLEMQVQGKLRAG